MGSRLIKRSAGANTEIEIRIVEPSPHINWKIRIHPAVVCFRLETCRIRTGHREIDTAVMSIEFQLSTFPRVPRQFNVDASIMRLACNIPRQAIEVHAAVMRLCVDMPTYIGNIDATIM